MAHVRGDSNSFFTEESYKAYIEKKGSVLNERLRGENETFFDALLSDKADISKTPEGKEVLELIGSFN